MRKEVCGIVLIGVVALMTGCSNRVVGHRGIHASVWNGHLGVTGHLNQVTIQKGSRLDKLSVIGDGNDIKVEEQVTLGKLEIWGENNTISIPDRLLIREDRIGKRNSLVRRKTVPIYPEVPAIEIYEPDNRLMGMPGETYEIQHAGQTQAMPVRTSPQPRPIETRPEEPRPAQP